jgi:hypothetical protein
VFDRLVEALIFGAGIADAACLATTLRRRRDEWIALGVFDRLRLAAPDAYEQMIGLELADVAVDGCITKAPCGGDCAGRSPVDRGKGGMKRSQLADGAGVPMPPSPRRPVPSTTPSCRRRWTRSRTSHPCRPMRRCTCTPVMTTAPAGKHSSSEACSARSRTAANPHLSRSAADG